MAPFGLKLWENAFQAIPDISFFDVEKFVSKLRTAVYPLRMAPFGLKLWENAFQTIPDISWFSEHFSNFLQTSKVHLPPEYGPIRLKLGQKAFQTIPNISSFSPENQKKMHFWSII